MTKRQLAISTVLAVTVLPIPAVAADLAASYEEIYSAFSGGSILVQCGASTLRVSKGLLGGISLELMEEASGQWQEKHVTSHSDSRVVFDGLNVKADRYAEPIAQALAKQIADRPDDGGLSFSRSYTPKRESYPIAAEASLDFFYGKIEVRTTEGATIIWDFDGMPEWEVTTTIPSGTAFQALSCKVRE